MQVSVQYKLDQVAEQTGSWANFLQTGEQERQSTCVNTLISSLPKVLRVSVWFRLLNLWTLQRTLTNLDWLRKAALPKGVLEEEQRVYLGQLLD